MATMDTTDVPAVIREVVERLVTAYAPERIILFGSYAWGQPDADSDIDLLIIKETPLRPMDRWMEVKRLLRDSDRFLDVSPLVYTSEEWDRRLAMGDSFLQEIVEKGKVLYG